MFTSKNSLVARAISECLLLVSILFLIGFFVYNKLDLTLKESLEESVALQSQSIAFGIQQQFDEEFKKLESCATLVERGQITFENLIDLSTVGTNGESMGILKRNGELIAGSPLTAEQFKLFENVFNGEREIKYRVNYGLMFAIPIQVDNETCLLYDCFNDEMARKRFGAMSYNGEGTLYFLNGASTEEHLLLSEGKELLDSPQGLEFYGWQLLNKQFEKNNRNTSAIFFNHKGHNYFLHISEISHKYLIAIVGYVPWRAVAVGIDYVYMIMFINFCIVLLMVMFGVRYVMQKREAEKLAQEKVIADSANKAKSEFLSNMSHEIRTPINAIMGMDEMILRESKDPNILEYGENLQNAARNLLGLVNDILDFSKIEAGKMEIIPVEYHISSMLNDLVNMVKKRAEKKGLEFIVNASPDIPSVLFGDEIRIKQVITNILTNAVKYTEEGSVTLDVNYKNIDDEKIYLIVSVVDTGIGIKEEDLKKLFSAFERIEEKRNRTIEGTGLGMNITQRLLSMMGTQLEVASIYGKGSTFKFKIEQKIMNTEPLGDFQEDYKRSLNQHKEYHETFTAPDARILVVDDTVMNLTVIKGLLKQTKIKVDTALNGADCISIVAKNKYDIIFLDHRMPGMDGIETLKIMQKMTSSPNINTPVISLTANAISGAREHYISVGFQDYLTKPINSSQLENLIMTYLPKEKIKAPDTTEKVEVNQEENVPEWLAHIEGIDAKKGIEHCGSVEAYMDALTIFAESIETAADLIENYYKSEDWKNYTTKVHALKSSAKVVGADELSEKARRLEDAGNSGYVNEIKEDTEPLLQLYRSYIDELSPLIKTGSDDVNKPLITDYDLEEAYEAMRDAVASFDYDSLNFVFESLDDFKLPEKEIERYRQIKKAASKLDWEKINELLE